GMKSAALFGGRFAIGLWADARAGPYIMPRVALTLPDGILQRDRDVSTQALYLGPLHGTAPQRGRQLVVCSCGERQQVDAIPCRARLPRRIGRPRRGGVPR